MVGRFLGPSGGSRQKAGFHSRYQSDGKRACSCPTASVLALFTNTHRHMSLRRDLRYCKYVAAVDEAMQRHWWEPSFRDVQGEGEGFNMTWKAGELAGSEATRLLINST